MVWHFARHGGWILDNFPQSKDVWLAFINDPIITPVEVVRLRESDPQVNNGRNSEKERMGFDVPEYIATRE